MIADFHGMCQDMGVFIPSEYRKDCINDTIIFYEKYLRTNNQKFVTIDFYKIISWYAVFVAERMLRFFKKSGIESENYSKVIRFAVLRMLKELKKTEKRAIEKAYVDKIISMVTCEIEGNVDFGIGKNGLYMLMLIARVVEIPPPPTP